jgi:hypothetical protein
MQKHIDGDEYVAKHNLNFDISFDNNEEHL